VLVLIATLAVVFFTSPAAGHHSFSAEFEADKTAELTGKIVQVWWNNPHIRYRLEVVRDGAKKLYVRSIVRPDGTRIVTGRPTRIRVSRDSA
jgi:hypothetical protein